MRPQPIPHGTTPPPPAHRARPPVPEPACRRLQVFASDPAAAVAHGTRRTAFARIAVAWERPGDLHPGPVGEYLEVIDIDPASGCAYDPVDLNQPELLAQDGLPPSEGVPQFHQQMAYAVAMKTIGHFAAALGRAPFWPDRRLADGTHAFVRRLRIYPHALREANAYYSPDRCALLFGYFQAVEAGGASLLPGGMVFTCLSFDIVAHETTHALLDGLHPRWKEPTSIEALAFHEAFADLVALFQHFTLPESLVEQIRRSRGRLRLRNALGALAIQFGQAVGGHGALRDALGAPPSPTAYAEAREGEPHQLGSLLVAAVFDAWLKVYEERTADLFRLATGGSGVLPPGEIPHDLAGRLAEEAALTAGHFLNICIRALDYCPPVEMTFGEYLRAMITADHDLVPDDPLGYRVALVEAFRARGIRAEHVPTFSPEALLWEAPEDPEALAPLSDLLAEAARDWRLDGDRLAAWTRCRDDAKALHTLLVANVTPETLHSLGLLPGPAEVDGMQVLPSGIEIHAVRPLRRIGPDNQVLSAVAIEITQGWHRAGANGQPEGPRYRGGCTVIWDRTHRCIRYVIRKRVGHAARADAVDRFHLALAEGECDSANYRLRDTTPREPFAVMHAPQ